MKTKIKITKNLFKRIEKLDYPINFKKEFLDRFEGKTIIFLKENFTQFIQTTDFSDIGCGKKNSSAGAILYYYLLAYVGKKEAEDFSRKFYWFNTPVNTLIEYAFKLIEGK